MTIRLGLPLPTFCTNHTILFTFWIVLKWVWRRANEWTVRFLINFISVRFISKKQIPKIIDDALRIASVSYLSYEKALHIVQYLQNETDYIPWKAAFDNFEFILNRFKPTEARTFEEFELKLLNRVYEHLGFYGKANDTSLDILNRHNILKHACKLGHK